MSKSLFSANWYRVADLRPRLRSHAEIHRQTFRGRVWYVLQDHATGRFHRISPTAYALVGLMDGSRTVREIWELAGSRGEGEQPTQDEVIQLLAQLHSSDLLVSEALPHLPELAHRSDRQRRRDLLSRVRNPMALRFALLDPDRFLDRTLPLVGWLYSVPGLILWLGLVISAAVLAGVHWGELTENVAERVLATENILLALLAYPVIKAIHELGHGYAVKRWGGEVHEIGIMLLVLMPVPYVDASAASAFRNKWRRIIVGSAGIMVELALASLALFVWLEAETGLVRAIAFNVMLIGGVSTLLFNGNPLLRFDGYYVFSDLIEIQNLGARANKYFFYLVQRYAFGVKEITSPVAAEGEAGWLAFYAVASFCYRMLVMIGIALFIGAHFFFIGVVLALWTVSTMLLVPIGKGAKFLLTGPPLRENRRRAFGVTGGAVAACVLILVAVPLPYASVAEGVVALPEGRAVRAGTAGIIREVLVEPHSSVAVGDPLLRLEDNLLRARIQLLEAQRNELQLRVNALMPSNLVQMSIFREQLRSVDGALEVQRQRAADLTLRSPADGLFVLPRAADLPGTFQKKGALLAYIIPVDGPLVHVVVPQSEMDLVRHRARNVEVRPAGLTERIVPADVLRESPAAANVLPSLALSTKGGGSIALDPMSSGRNQALQRFYQLELKLREPLPVAQAGGRVFVRFQYGHATLGERWLRSLRQLFLSRFDV